MHPGTALSSSRLSFPITNLQPSSSRAHLWALLRSVQKQNLFPYKARIFHWETGFPDLANLVAPVLQVSSVWHHPHATGTRQQQPRVMRGFGFHQGGKGSEMAQAGVVQPCGVTHGQMQHPEPAFHEELALLMRPESGSGISHTGDGWTRAPADTGTAPGSSLLPQPRHNSARSSWLLPPASFSRLGCVSLLLL